MKNQNSQDKILLSQWNYTLNDINVRLYIAVEKIYGFEDKTIETTKWNKKKDCLQKVQLTLSLILKMLSP